MGLAGVLLGFRGGALVFPPQFLLQGKVGRGVGERVGRDGRSGSRAPQHEWGAVGRPDEGPPVPSLRRAFAAVANAAQGA
eukprot:8487840-Pyramimonas_sp.AAC.1